MILVIPFELDGKPYAVEGRVTPGIPATRHDAGDAPQAEILSIAPENGATILRRDWAARGFTRDVLDSALRRLVEEAKFDPRKPRYLIGPKGEREQLS